MGACSDERWGLHADCAFLGVRLVRGAIARGIVARGDMAVRMESRQRLHLRGLGVSLVRIAVLTVVFVGSAAASSSARWLAPQSVGRSTISFAAVNSGFVPNETQPVVAFDRSGAAGLAFVDGVSTLLAERSAGGRFSSPVLLAQGSGGVVNPFGLAFTSTGETVALLHVFDDLGQGGNECCDQLAGLVRPEHRSPEVQTLGRLAQYPFAGQLGPDPGSGLYSAGVALLPVADGVLGFTGAGQVWELVNGATQFDRLSDLTTSAVGRSVVSVAADGVGGAFATWETSDETGLVTGPVMVYVAYRAPGHSFRPPVRTALGPAGSVVGPDFVSSPLIAAWGRRRADFAWVLDTPTNRSDPSEARVWNQHLQVAFRSRNRLGHPRTLAVVRHAPVVENLNATSILVDRTGAPTLAWTDCTAVTCSVEIAVSRRAAMVGKPQVLDRRATVSPGLSIAGDGRGDEVAAWWSSRGLKAATRRGGSVKFGRARLLMRQVAPIDGGQSTSPPYAAFGPRGEAIVAWITDAGNLEADVYQLRH